MKSKALFVFCVFIGMSGCSKHSSSHSTSASYITHEKLLGMDVEVKKDVRTKEQCMRIAENFANMDVQKHRLAIWKNKANNDPYTTLEDISSDPHVIDTERAMFKVKTDDYFNLCWDAQQKRP